MKIALYKDMEFGYETVLTHADERYRSKLVRISKYVDVEFPPLSGDRIVQQQIDKLDELADRATEEYRRTLAGILERKSKLLAITLQPERRP